MKRLSRRTVLRGAGGVTLALPFLNAMSCTRSPSTPGGVHTGVARAQHSLDGFPKRFVVFYTPNGFIESTRQISGSENNFTLSGSLAPLDAYKEHLLIPSGIDFNVYLGYYNGGGAG